MAALIGYLQGNKGSVSRLGSKNSGIQSSLQTWKGSIRTILEEDGTFTVYIGEKHGGGNWIITGNVDTQTVAKVREPLL